MTIKIGKWELLQVGFLAGIAFSGVLVQSVMLVGVAVISGFTLYVVTLLGQRM